MIISHAKNFIFIHNYKVAGTSVRQALCKYNSSYFSRYTLINKFYLSIRKRPLIYSNEFPAHITANELKRQLPTYMFEKYFKFGFVRNPWDWQVSLYIYMLKAKDHQSHKFIKNMRNFDEYIEWRVNKDRHLQKDFFYNENGVCLVDFIGKIEYLQDSFRQICRQININETIPHLNKSREDSNYLHYYTNNSIKMVHDAFKEDIELFGYKCPQWG